MRSAHVTHYAALVLGLAAALTARAQSNLVAISVTSAAALKGRAIEPFRDSDADGVTVFCTVVVDNLTGQPFAAAPQPWVEQSNLLFKTEQRDGRTYQTIWLENSSAFDHLSLSVCDESGRTLSSHPYYWQSFSQLPRYVTLLEGRTTNSLCYRVFGVSRTNREIPIRLEGSFRRSDRWDRWATSAIVRAKLY